MEPLALDAYAARTCAVKTWNRYAPGVELPTPPVPRDNDESLREGFDGGLSFTDAVLERLLEVSRVAVTDLRALADQPPAAQQEACLTAMAAGDPVIVSGLLPRDLVGHRVGRPTLWVRGGDTADGRPGYLPVITKPRRVTERRQSGRESSWSVDASALTDVRPAAAVAVDERVIRTGRDGDLIQLGHYWRLAEAAGVAPAGPALGGIIGTDPFSEAADEDPHLWWVPLDEPMVRTFSRSSETGWRLRTILERHDHEHAFRVTVAENARSSEPPIVAPIRNRECDACDWWEVCRPKLGDDDLSVRIDKAPLDVREIQALRALGVRTVTDLAAVDLAELKPRYLPEVRHRDRAEQRLETAAHRARLLVDHVDLERASTGPIDVPGAELEIDFDIETASDERVYLWGFWVHDRSSGEPPRYQEFSAWHDLSRDEEYALAEEAMSWLLEQVAQASSVKVYHYSSYETVRLSQLARASGSPVLREALEWSREGFVDLFPIVRDHFFGVRGLGLKVVATIGAGFAWRDEEPGGLNSQSWFDEACHAEDPAVREAARARVLAYNEDDVRATWTLRRWLREL